MRELWLILHFIGLSLGFGLGLANLLVFLKVRRLSAADRPPIMGLLKPVRTLSHVGLLLLLISGAGLVWDIWPGILDHPIFLWKMILVGLLVLLVANNLRMQRRIARTAGPPPQPPIWLLPLPAVLSVAIVVLAVLVFR